MDISEITVVKNDGNTLNCSKLPKVQYFKVQVQGVTGRDVPDVVAVAHG